MSEPAQNSPGGVAPPPQSRPELAAQHRVIWALLIIAVAGMVGAAILKKQSEALDALPALGKVGDFSFTDHRGRTVTAASLKGKVWVADFIFTRCAGTCLAMTQSMHALETKLDSGIRLVSFSMDPEYDTPKVLAEYAKGHGAENKRWHFVTGSKDEMYRITRDDFKLVVKEEGGSREEPIIHSEKFVLVDRQGRIRGYYSGMQPEGSAQLAIDAQRINGVYSKLPAVNAGLNTLCTILLLVGYVLVKQRKLDAHRNFMIAAGTTSALFLTTYLIYHFEVGSVKFEGEGTVKTVYLAILLTHVILAMAIAVIVPLTFWHALAGAFERHKRIARITFPIWLYVSITGVIVYWMLYQM